VSKWLVTIPDEADGRLGPAVLEAVEAGASNHTLLWRFNATDDRLEELRHSRLAVTLTRQTD
jgi:hypothetical protein